MPLAWRGNARCRFARDRARERHAGWRSETRLCALGRAWRAAAGPRRGGDQALRRPRGGRSAFARDLSGRVLCAARAVGLRQDHVAAHDRRLRAAERRPHPARWRRYHARAAVSAADQHDVPELRVVSAPDGRGQHRVRAQAGRLAPRGDRRARRRHAGAGEARRSRPAQAAPAFGRAAPARGAGAFAGQAPARAAARRADGGARQEAARGDAVRADGIAAQARADLRHRHPRSERGDDGRRPHRGDGPRPAHAGGDASGHLRAAEFALGRRLHRRRQSVRGPSRRRQDEHRARRRPAGCVLRRRSMPTPARRCGSRCGRRRCG